MINRRPEKFVTGLYFWGYDFYTDIEDYCNNNNKSFDLQIIIAKVVNSIDWEVIGQDSNSWKNRDYTEQWDLVKTQLIDYIEQGMPSNHLYKIFTKDECVRFSLNKSKSETVKFIKEWILNIHIRKYYHIIK